MLSMALQALTTGYDIGTWGVAQDIVYNRKGAWQLRDSQFSELSLCQARSMSFWELPEHAFYRAVRADSLPVTKLKAMQHKQ